MDGQKRPSANGSVYSTGTRTVISDFPVREPILQAPEIGVREVAKDAVMCLCIKITVQKFIIVIKIMLRIVMSLSSI